MFIYIYIYLFTYVHIHVYNILYYNVLYIQYDNMYMYIQYIYIHMYNMCTKQFCLRLPNYRYRTPRVRMFSSTKHSALVHLASWPKPRRSMVLEYLPKKLGHFVGRCRQLFQHHGSNLENITSKKDNVRYIQIDKCQEQTGEPIFRGLIVWTTKYRRSGYTKGFPLANTIW